jgi:hypothetical protein
MHKNVAKYWGAEQKIYAMTENIFGMTLLLIFKAFKVYPAPFWIFVMLHSLVKITISMFKIFDGATLTNRLINGLVVAADILRYIFYLVIYLWTKESKIN